jgi:ankyrin repeat protein
MPSQEYIDLFESDTEESEASEEPLPPLQAAVDTGEVDTVRQLASTADPADLTAALCRSCQLGNKALVEALVDTGRCDINAAADGETPLFLAARKLDPSIVKFLLEHNADISVKSKEGTLQQERPSTARSKMCVTAGTRKIYSSWKR